jgi:phospholipid transport system substrate-binding protein
VRRAGELLGAFVVLGVVVAAAQAGPPSDQLKTGIDQVVKVLADPVLKTEARAKARRDALRAIAAPLFDWTELAKRALGRHWSARTEPQREEFVRLFPELIERSYYATLERYNGERVVYGAESIEGDRATVRTKVLNKDGRELLVDYRLRRVGARWLVYDVLIQGVSLVSNYRAQFDQIIRTSSYEQLVERLKSPSS